MKKYKILLCFLFLLSCLTGCSSKVPKAPDSFGTSDKSTLESNSPFGIEIEESNSSLEEDTKK